MNKTPNYLVENKQNIIGKKEQNNPYSNNYLKVYNHSSFSDIPIVKKFKNEFDLTNGKLTKNDVIKLFKQDDLYFAIVCSMIWGGINATRSKDKKATFFYKFLSHPKEKVIEDAKSVIRLLEEKKIKEAFEFYQKEAKIIGIGPAYFTKIFYFLGEVNDSISLKPLIFDKWTTNAYLALLLENKNYNKVKEYFKSIKFNISKTPGIISINEKKYSECYQEFVLDFNTWSKDINCNPSTVEEFIFGNHLGKDKSISNPRIQLWNIILKNHKPLFE